VRDFLAHLAVRQNVSASTQNQAFCAILFLCREVLGLNVETTMIYVVKDLRSPARSPLDILRERTGR